MSISDLFDLNTGIGKLGLLGLLTFELVFVLIGNYMGLWVSGREHKVTVALAERSQVGWEKATEQFERALDLIEKWQDRRRFDDATERR